MTQSDLFRMLLFCLVSLVAGELLALGIMATVVWLFLPALMR